MQENMTNTSGPKRAGTDALKLVLQGIGDAANLASQVSTGFKIGELLLLVQLGQDVTAILSDKDLIIPQYLDLTDAERQELTAFVASNVKFPASATVESYLQKLLDVAIALSKLFN